MHTALSGRAFITITMIMVMMMVVMIIMMVVMIIIIMIMITRYDHLLMVEPSAPGSGSGSRL